MQRGGGKLGVLRRQVPGLHRGIDAKRDLARDLATTCEPGGGDIDIDRLGQDAPSELALGEHMHGNSGHGRGQRR